MTETGHAATLDDLLRAARLSDREVERRTGICRVTLRKIRKGATRRPVRHVCERLARLLGVPEVEVLAAVMASAVPAPRKASA